MAPDERANILLVDDQPAKLISYEVMLDQLGENLIKASSAREALECLLKNEIAVLLVDVCMPDLDGFELAAMVRDHPRYQKTAIIFISAIHLADDDRLRGYKMGAVDYMPVPVVPEILRAKVKVFVDLHRKTRQLEELNRGLELRVAERTADLEELNARLANSEEQLRLATEAGEIGLWDVDNVAGTLFWPPRVKAMFGISSDVPVSMDDFFAGLHPEDREATSAAYAAACDPDRRAQYDVEYRTVGKEDGVVRWVEAKGRGLFDGAGRCIRVLGTAVDITERKRVEEYHALLAREIDHRAKNALAVVQSIVRLTKAPTTDDYVKAVDGRIKALSHAHTLLSESRWKGAGLRNLAQDELAPYGLGSIDRISLAGGDINLVPAMAQCLTLVLHELATNSAKYGALSVPGGRLDLSWQTYASSLILEWIESRGPRVTEPESTGFGISVIRASVENQLQGAVSLDWRPEGLYCRISVPMLGNSSFADPKVTKLERPESPAINGVALHRVMLVEDETIVAMMLQDALTEAGLEVVGPFTRVRDALKAAKTTSFTAAVLDINLAGELVYDLADYLMGAGVPFVFMTGYDGESVDARFRNVPVLCKPVNVEQMKVALGNIVGQSRSFSATHS